MSILTASWSVYEITLDDHSIVVNPVISRELKRPWSFGLTKGHESQLALGSPWHGPDGMVTNKVTGILVR